MTNEQLQHNVAMRREAGAVTRWHLIPHIGVDSVANHSWNATMLLLELNPTASRQLIVYMMNHDVTERWIGDVPASSKGMFPLISKGVRVAEEWLEIEFDIPSARGLTEHERQWARAIDALESAIWCREQMRMGNQLVANALESLDEWIMGEEWIPATIQTFYVNYKYKRTADYVTEGKHYGNNE